MCKKENAVKRFILAGAAVLAVLAGGAVSAEDITADVLTYNGKTKVATATGHVVIHGSDGETVTGDHGEYRFDDRSAYLTGSVHYQKGSNTMDAETIHVSQDKTVTGTGGVYAYDAENQRTLRGDYVSYNSETGYGLVEGNGFVQTPDGQMTAPHIEGNAKQIYMEASGGVNFESTAHNIVGYGDNAVYTKTPDREDGKVVLTGNARATQNGNTFEGPELVFTAENNLVKTNGRSTLVITNTSGK